MAQERVISDGHGGKCKFIGDQLKVITTGNVSTNNSSTTTLGIDGVFTGTADKICDYASIAVILKTDQDSATDGLSLEWSPDGINWDHIETYTITANQDFTTQAMIEAKFFRVVYTNGSTAQGFFRLQVIFMQVPSVGEIQQLGINIDNDGDAQLVRAVLAGQKPDNSYTNIGATTGGNAKVSIEEFDPTASIPAGTNTIGSVKLTDGTTVLSLDPLVESVPTTDTFHHLGHEGKVFIHSDRHNNIANGANFDMLIRIPAGAPTRQVHMRFNYIGKAVTGTLDVDIILYKDTTVSADGSSEAIASTNDANVKSTGVTMFSGPTVTSVGTIKAWTMMAGEKKSASSKEQSVPEYVLAPNGSSERLYLMRAINNSGGIINIVNALFFYDSLAS